MLHALSFSEASPEHQNEDRFVLEQLPASTDCWFGVVADGQGGRAGGAEAARLACDSILSKAREASITSLGNPQFWRGAFDFADHSVNHNPEAGYTTLTSFCVFGGYVYGASCGDSAAFISNSNVQFIELSAQQQKNPQIGSGMTSCTFFSSPLARPWSALAATDGVWKYVGREKLQSLVETMKGESLASALESAGRLPGSGKFPDDFTFIILQSEE